MLGKFKVVATIPVTDLDRAKAFYGDTLGLTATETTPFAVRYACGGGTELSIFKRGPSKADHTLAHFEVDDVVAIVAALRGKGVEFLEYDGPGLKTVNHVCVLGAEKAAWFKDTEGNYLCIHEDLNEA